MKVMRAIQGVTTPNWRNKDGRPKGSGTAQDKVKEWKELHPNGKKADCIKDTGLSKHTVYKWWAEAQVNVVLISFVIVLPSYWFVFV